MLLADRKNFTELDIFMEKEFVEVEIFGEKYKLVSDYQDNEKLKRVASMVNEKMDELAKSFPTYSKTKIAILAALNLVDELINLSEHYQNVDSKVMRVLTTIDNKFRKSS